MGTKGTDTKQRILHTAFELFGRHGFEGVTVRTLTEEAGVNQAAVNYHFGSKEALFRAVFDSHMTQTADQVRQAMAGPESYPERFRQVVRTLVDYLGDNSRWVHMLVRELLAGGSRLPFEADQQIPRLVQHVREFLAHGIEQGYLREHDSLLGAMSVLSMLVYLVVAQDRLRAVVGIDIQEEPFRRALADHHATVLWRGLAREEGSP